VSACGEMRDGDQVAKVSLPMSTNPQGGGRSSAPILTHKTEPQYTDEARSAKLQGTVMLQVQIDETGKVSEHITVLRSVGSGLDEKAIEAVKQWRFRPALRDGKPVAVPATIEVNFRL
jgi:TonB family protein